MSVPAKGIAECTVNAERTDPLDLYPIPRSPKPAMNHLTELAHLR